MTAKIEKHPVNNLTDVSLISNVFDATHEKLSETTKIFLSVYNQKFLHSVA